jgi:phage tail sheath protein FI
MPTYDVPGVYIEEQTGPGVIAGVGTSTAAFIGPALRGPINEAQRISSFDEFLNLYAISQPDGSLWPYMTSPHWFYMAHAVRGFFENGGRQAYIVRVGTARAAAWDVKNNANEVVFRVQAKQEGVGGDNITVQVQSANATGVAGRDVAKGTATVQIINGVNITVNNASPFRVGDIVTKDESVRATIDQIQGNVLMLSKTLAGLAQNDTLRIGNIVPTQNTFRMATTTGLYPGSVVKIKGDDADHPGTSIEEYAVIETVDRAVGFVTVASAPARTKKFNLAAAVAPVLISQEFRLIVTPPGASAETFDNLSLNPLHPNYVFAAVTSNGVRIRPPQTPPGAAGFPNSLVNPVGNVALTVNGQNDDPSGLTSTEYRTGLNVLRDVDDVNILSIPDAAAHSEYVNIQKEMINHCLALKDRFSLLDSRPGAPVSGSGSVEEHRGNVQSDRGFAALYYPWLVVRDPTSTGPIPRTMLIPPSGHVAGVYARTDGERGVHKAPANTEVRGVLGIEQRLSDGQHGPLNLKGINVLRIFPGAAQVLIWGARTTVDPNITDWLYVNVRRLMLYIEESIEEGIRWAVFEPNNLALWQKLKRTISEFLTRAWRDGALFGETAEKAFYVRIDEALNPASTRAIGRLYIEIGVAPVRPAEFIIVRIGLWDGGSEVAEG